MDVLNDRKVLIKTVTALKDLSKSDARNKARTGLKQLFADDDDNGSRTKLYLMLSLIKLPSISKDGQIQPLTIRSPIPHSFINKFTNVLLITRNLKEHSRNYEATLQMFKDRLREHDALSLVSEVMPLKQLEIEYKDFESKRHLAQRFDVVLCDKSIKIDIPKFLGKPFYSVKKRPIPVNLEGKDLRQVISNCLSRSILHMNLEGSCSTAQIGRMDQSDEELADNILSTIKTWRKSLPGRWANVRSINLKSQNSKSLPLYLSLTCPQEIPAVVHPFATKDDVVACDYLNTISSAKRVVAIKRSGDIVVIPRRNLQRERKKPMFIEEPADREVYNPAANEIIRDGVAVREKIMKRRAFLTSKWNKKSTKWSKGGNGRLSTNKHSTKRSKGGSGRLLLKNFARSKMIPKKKLSATKKFQQEASSK